MDFDDLNLSRTKFSAAEDELLRKTVQKYGAKKWNTIAQHLPGRTARQCRDRFQNYLSPDLTNGPWSHEEDLLLLEKVDEYGSCWSKINKFFVGRSPNNIKNRYNTHLAKSKYHSKKHLKKVAPSIKKEEENECDVIKFDDVVTAKLWEAFNSQGYFSNNLDLLFIFD